MTAAAGPSRRGFLLGGAAFLASLGMRSRPRPMLQRTIPSTGERVPAIGLGTWQTFDVGAGAAERAPLAEVLRVFHELGGRVIDSSPMYGRSEDVVGDLVSAQRPDPPFFVATKVWTRGRADGIRQMEESMRKLRVDRLELMQVHNLVDAETHLDTLAGWKREGRIRYLGVTHYNAGAHADLEAAIRRWPLDFVQVNLSIAEPGAADRVLPAAADRGVAVMINRPFAAGAMFRAVRGRALPGWAADYDAASWAQLFLNYVLSYDAVTVAIPATSDPAHLRDNMAAGLGPLPDAVGRRRIADAIG